jgi:hypothetical protein
LRFTVAVTRRAYVAPAAFPLLPPASAWEQAAWVRVARAELGLVPALRTTDRARWQAFLRRRHRTPTALARSHGLAAEIDFPALDAPSTLPATPGGFRDWYDFETVVLARARRAHRFSVLLPLCATTAAARGEAAARRAVAERVVALQKPAHTVFDVRFYTSMFRVGDARLGLETVLERSAREALAPAIVDAGYVGEARLSAREEDARGACPDERRVLR